MEDVGMKRTIWYLGLMGLMMTAVGCGNSKTADSLLNDSDSVAAIPEVSVSPLPDPIADSAQAANRPLPVPALIPPTLTPQRLPQINAGRRDPFAAIAVDPIVVPAPATVPGEIQPLTSQPTVALQPIPLQPQAAIPQPQTVAIAPAPAPVPQPVAPAAPQDTVRVSGVVQVGGRLSAIVELPGARGSQYISEGEYFDNGRILVKRIDVSSGEPRVILEHNGIETVRMVGSSGALMGAL
jgi:Tfp pilus assembly protein PilP